MIKNHELLHEAKGATEDSHVTIRPLNLVDTLSAVTLDEHGIQFLCSIGEPSTSGMHAASAKALRKICQRTFTLWVDLLPGRNHARVSLKGHPEFSSSKIRSHLIAVVAMYFECAARRILFRANRGSLHLVAGFKVADRDSFLPPTDRKVAKTEDEFFQGVSYHYFTILMSMWLSGLAPHIRHVANLQPLLDSKLHHHLLSLFHLSLHLRTAKRRLAARRLTEGVLVLLTHHYGKLSELEGTAIGGPFSSIRLGELEALSKRTPRAVELYGRKRVESVFEQQLALVLQSLGYIVVSTRRAESTVDLVCISPRPDDTTILVEAKTSRKAYGLPTRDQRALRDYIRDVRLSLKTLPPLRLVLIVGPSASRTLESKLVSLEVEGSVPVRFLTARQLANLRRMLPGPLDPRSFLSKICSATRVLNDKTILTIVAEAEKERKAHTAYVETLLGGARGRNAVLAPLSRQEG